MRRKTPYRRNAVPCFLFLLGVSCVTQNLPAQNVGIGTTTPGGTLHIKGNADTSQLVIDAGNPQSNTRPLIRMRNFSGQDLAWIHSDNPLNVFIGAYAGQNNTGANNSFFGSAAGSKNTSGAGNTAAGFESLRSNVLGTQNTAIGNRAMYTNLGGSNTAIGSHALFSNTSGQYNTAVGVEALYSNTYQINNTAVGYQAMRSNTSGATNAAVGAYAMLSNTTGSANSAFGMSALQLGNGVCNTAVGNSSLRLTTSGLYNTAFGCSALFSNVTNQGNTALGYYTLYNTNAADFNTAVGYNAGRNFNNGYNNVFVGANTDVNGAGYFNVVAVGQGTVVGASSTARFGNAATGSYGGWANWTNVSDARYKKDINENVPGLAFILKLRPVTYHLMAVQLSKDLGENYGDTDKQMIEALQQKETKLQTGFVAQEVEAAAKELGYDFSGIDQPQNAKSQYGLRYAEFVVPLVKAVQEQQLIIDELRKKNEAQEARLQKLEKVLTGSN